MKQLHILLDFMEGTNQGFLKKRNVTGSTTPNDLHTCLFQYSSKFAPINIVKLLTVYLKKGAPKLF